MKIIRSFQDFFTKRNLDFEDPDFNLDKYHPQIKVFYAINGIFFNNKESKLRYIWPVICIILSTIGICLQISFVIYGINEKDFASAAESFVFLIIIATIPIILFSILCNRQKIFSILNVMNEHLMYIFTLDVKYKNIFLRGQLIIWKFCICWMTFSSLVSSSFIFTCLAKLIYQSLFATLDVNTQRPLVLPTYLSFDDPHRSPNYELFLAFHCMLAFIFVHTFAVFVYTLFHILLHCIYIMDMIFLDFDVIFDGLDENLATLSKYNPRRIEVQLILNRRIKRVVDWHLSVFKLVDLTSSLFGLPLALQVSISAIAICLMAYQIVDYMEQGKIHVLFLLLSVSTYIQLWVPCYLGSLLKDQAFEIGGACWRSGWQNTRLGQLIRSDLIILISKAQQPLTIRFPGLPQMELSTFSSIITTSYSYFNILRQYK